MKQLAVLSVFFLAGCQFWIVGHTDDNGIVVHGPGTADPLTGTTKFTLAADGADVKCTGHSFPKPGAVDQRAIVKLDCDDGRKGEGETWITIPMETGEGTGTDTCGNVYTMFFSIDKGKVDAKLAEYRKAMEESGNAFNDKCDAPGDIPAHTDPLI